MQQQNLFFNILTFDFPQENPYRPPHFEGADIPPFGKDNLWFL
jgi:hypothetical protein